MLGQDHKRLGLVQGSVKGLGTRIQGVLQSIWSGICPGISSSKRVGTRIVRSLHSILEVKYHLTKRK